MPKSATIKKGDVFTSSKFGDYVVAEYVSAAQVTIVFKDTGNIKTTSATSVRKGSVKDNYAPTVLGVGIKGDALSHVERKPIKEYQLWVDMLERCFSSKGKAKSYKECNVSDNFKHYTYFKQWCNEQIGFGLDGWHMDKDLLSNKNGKMYSENTCCFIPPELNCIFGTNKSVRGLYPIGVKKYSHGNNFSWRMKVGEEVLSGHGYVTQEEAFFDYKQAKESRLKELAEKWKDQIDPRAYEALMSYQVEITD